MKKIIICSLIIHLYGCLVDFNVPTKDFEIDENKTETVIDGNEAISENLDSDLETENKCSLPPLSPGLYIFYCLNENRTTSMTLWRMVKPVVEWGIEPGCTTSNTRSILCQMDTSQYENLPRKKVDFNIEIPNIGMWTWFRSKSWPTKSIL